MLQSRMGSQIGWDGRGRVEWVRVANAHVAGLELLELLEEIPVIWTLL